MGLSTKQGLLTAAGTALLAAVRRLAPAIEAAAPEIESSGRIPQPLAGELVRSGIYRMTVPRSLGGLELPLRDFAAVLLELAKADGSVAWCVSQNSGVCLLAANLPRQGAEEVFGPADAVLAGGHGSATAVRVQGGYRLTGSWSFGSGMHQATWLRGTCELVDEHGHPLRQHRERGSMVLFFPAAAAEVSQVWRVSGLRGTGSDSYSVRDLFVPERHGVCDDRFEPGPLYVFDTNHVFAVGFASVALGIARASLDAFVDLAVNKRPRGMHGVLREQALVQSQVAQAEAAWRSARSLLNEAIDEAWQAAAERGALTLDERVALRLATTFAIQRAAEVVDTAYHLAGATAIFNSNAFERRFRDVHAVTQQMQARQDHYETVGKHLLGLEARSEWL